MERREFLVAVGGAAAAGLATPRTARAQKSSNQARLARIAIMSLGFANILKNINQPDSPERVVDIMDIGEMYADRYGVHNVELQHAHLPSTEPAWLLAFRAKLAKSKSQVTNINLEFGNTMTITAESAVGRLQAVDLTKRWIDHAVALGSPRLMINQGQPTEENKAVAIPTLKAMGDYGRLKGVMVGMENRGSAQPVPGSTTPPRPAHDLLVEIIKGAGTHTNCDLGNFLDQATQHAGIRAMLPLTDGNVHIKLNPQRYDLPAAIALTRQLGYKGLYSIEANLTMGPDPYENTQKIYNVLVDTI